MRSAVVALFLFAGTLHAQDARWTLLKTRSDSTRFEADFHDVKVNWHGGYLLWTRVTFPHAINQTTANNRTVLVKQMVEQSFVDCKRHQDGWTQEVAYDASGNSVMSADVRFQSLKPSTRDPVPGSVGETMIKEVCEHYLGGGA